MAGDGRGRRQAGSALMLAWSVQEWSGVAALAYKVTTTPETV